MAKTIRVQTTVFAIIAVLGTIMLSGCTEKPDIAAINAEETYPAVVTCFSRPPAI